MIWIVCLLGMELTSDRSSVKPELSLLDCRLERPGAVKLSNDDPFTVIGRLRNDSKNSIKLWDPKNTEGSMCVFAAMVFKHGPVIELESLPIPRAGGIPTSISLAPGASIPVLANLRWSLSQHKIPVGRYNLTLIYRNAIQSHEPVFGVWIGTIKSKPISLEIVK